MVNHGACWIIRAREVDNAATGVGVRVMKGIACSTVIGLRRSPSAVKG
jgi:hypothetical protein